MSTSNAAATAVNTAPSQAPVDPFDDPVTSNKMAVHALIPLLITFVLGTLCLQPLHGQGGASARDAAQDQRSVALRQHVAGLPGQVTQWQVDGAGDMAAGEFAGQLRDSGQAAELATRRPIQMHHADEGKYPDDPPRNHKAHGRRSTKMCE